MTGRRLALALTLVTAGAAVAQTGAPVSPTEARDAFADLCLAQRPDYAATADLIAADWTPREDGQGYDHPDRAITVAIGDLDGSGRISCRLIFATGADDSGIEVTELFQALQDTDPAMEIMVTEVPDVFIAESHPQE